MEIATSAVVHYLTVTSTISLENAASEENIVMLKGYGLVIIQLGQLAGPMNDSPECWRTFSIA